MPRRLIASLILGWSGLALAAVSALAPADQELLHNARFWEAHDRGDLAQLALKKLVVSSPDLPAALLDLGELDLRMNDFAGAHEVENELNRRFPSSPAASNFSDEVRIATRDRLQFASIHRLLELNRNSEAAAQLHQLFPHGPPGGALGVEYYQLLARTPGGEGAAVAGMRTLLQSHADDPRYQLGMAQLLVRQKETAAEGVALLQRLTQRDDVRRDDVDRALASGLLRLGAERAPRAALDAYLARHSDDKEITALLLAQQQLSEEQTLQANADRSRALPESQRMLARELVSGSGAAAGHAEAARWLERSRLSLKEQQRARAAAELRAALAFDHGNYEAQIGVARELETVGAAAESGELLASAARLAPSSGWLFETRLRWLIAHGDSDAALSLLRGAAVPPSLAAKTRSELLAQALEAHADRQMHTGHTAAARDDLLQAVAVAPRDAWTRYRLAELYRAAGEGERGRNLMSDGVDKAPDEPDMRYAQGLYLEHLEAYRDAYAAIDAVDPARRTDGMNALRDRMRVAVARSDARRLQAAGDLAGARAALRGAEPAASGSFERATELAYSWISLGDAAHGLALVQPYASGAGAHDPRILLSWAQLLDDAEDDGRLRPVLGQLRHATELSAENVQEVNRLERALELRDIRTLERQGKYPEAARRLDGLLVAEPQDRRLRLARAELDLMAGQPRAARDRLAALTAEDPDDIDARLSYVRALTESGDRALASAQLDAIEPRVDAGNDELEISLARRQLALGSPAKALHTLQPLLARPQPRTDVLMLAGHAEQALRHFAQAGDYFARAAAAATGADLVAARRAEDALQERVQSSVSGGLLVWHQPGSPGMSQIDAVTLPSVWSFGRDDGSHLIARADAVWLDAGRWSSSAQSPLLLGTIQAAGPAAVVRYTDDRQVGLSPALGFQSGAFAADIGATPLGFLLPNVVGGLEWTPDWRSLDLTFGASRRAVTSSELSYAGLRDPISGTAWGGVVQTGPYAGFGIYRENYDVSGSVRFVEITGDNVANNQLFAARLASSWKFFAREDARADAGVALTYWSYERNLSNYTFGSGGYYSPQSYVSLATPLELTGTRAGWSYRLRAAVSYTLSQVSGSAFYPDDAALQAQAARAPLPPGYSSPYFSGYHSNGVGFSAYAAAERTLSEKLVVGAALDIDRTDYYHPTSIEIYLRHTFGPGRTRSASPPRPPGPYSP